MAKDREPNREERKGGLPEDLPGNQTDLPGRRQPSEHPNQDVERMPGDGGSIEKI